MREARSEPSSLERLVRFELAGYVGAVTQADEKAIVTGLLPEPWNRVRAGHVLDERPAVITSRLALGPQRHAIVSAERPRTSLDTLLRRWRSSECRRVFEATRHLEGLGVPVARALAWGERRSGPLLREAFFASGDVPAATPLGQHLRDGSDADVRRPWLLRLGAFVRALHDRGFDHRALHVDHLHLTDGPPDQARFRVGALHEVRLGKTVAAGARREALARLLGSLEPMLRSGESRALLDGYYENAPAADDERARIEERVRGLQRAARDGEAGRCVAASRSFSDDVGRGRGLRHHQLPLDALERLLAAHDTALEGQDDRVAKRGRKGAVTCHGEAVVKELWAANAWGRLRQRLAPQRLRAGFRNARLLQAAGVPVARPLAWLARGGRHFVLFQDLSRFERFDLLAGRLWRDGPRTEQLRFLQHAAAWLADLHQRGIYHGDLKGINVRVERRPDLLRCHLIDVDHVRFFDQPLDLRRRVKNLAQLAASIPQVVSRTDRLRWYRRYAQATQSGGDLREINGAVREALAQKRVVVDEPIE